jgi:hypothetical protein
MNVKYTATAVYADTLASCLKAKSRWDIKTTNQAPQYVRGQLVCHA